MNGVQREVDRMDGSVSIYITHCPTYILFLDLHVSPILRSKRNSSDICRNRLKNGKKLAKLTSLSHTQGIGDESPSSFIVKD